MLAGDLEVARRHEEDAICRLKNLACPLAVSLLQRGVVSLKVCHNPIRRAFCFQQASEFGLGAEVIGASAAEYQRSGAKERIRVAIKSDRLTCQGRLFQARRQSGAGPSGAGRIISAAPRSTSAAIRSWPAAIFETAISTRSPRATAASAAEVQSVSAPPHGYVRMVETKAILILPLQAFLGNRSQAVGITSRPSCFPPANQGSGAITDLWVQGFSHAAHHAKVLFEMIAWLQAPIRRILS